MDVLAEGWGGGGGLARQQRSVVLFDNFRSITLRYIFHLQTYLGRTAEFG
jgi:hypothetical protein